MKGAFKIHDGFHKFLEMSVMNEHDGVLQCQLAEEAEQLPEISEGPAGGLPWALICSSPLLLTPSSHPVNRHNTTIIVH